METTKKHQYSDGITRYLIDGKLITDYVFFQELKDAIAIEATELYNTLPKTPESCDSVADFVDDYLSSIRDDLRNTLIGEELDYTFNGIVFSFLV